MPCYITLHGVVVVDAVQGDPMLPEVEFERTVGGLPTD
jgi:hypothetical protein